MWRMWIHGIFIFFLNQFIIFLFSFVSTCYCMVWCSMQAVYKVAWNYWAGQGIDKRCASHTTSINCGGLEEDRPLKIVCQTKQISECIIFFVTLMMFHQGPRVWQSSRSQEREVAVGAVVQQKFQFWGTYTWFFHFQHSKKILNYLLTLSIEEL